MDIKIKEPLYIVDKGYEHVVRPGTAGVERNRVIFFYDTTRTSAVGFSRDFCLENPQVFQISRTLSDKEISVKDALRAISESGLPSDFAEQLSERIKSL